MVKYQSLQRPCKIYEIKIETLCFRNSKLLGLRYIKISCHFSIWPKLIYILLLLLEVCVTIRNKKTFQNWGHIIPLNRLLQYDIYNHIPTLQSKLQSKHSDMRKLYTWLCKKLNTEWIREHFNFFLWIPIFIKRNISAYLSFMN